MSQKLILHMNQKLRGMKIMLSNLILKLKDEIVIPWFYK